jgi:hypothetical protein
LPPAEAILNVRDGESPMLDRSPLPLPWPALPLVLLALLLALAGCAGNGGSGGAVAGGVAKKPALERVLIVYRPVPRADAPAGAASAVGRRNIEELLPHLFARLPLAFEAQGVQARMVLEPEAMVARPQAGEMVLTLQPDAASANAAPGQEITLRADLVEPARREMLWRAQVRSGVAGVGPFDALLADGIGQRMVASLRAAGWIVAQANPLPRRAVVASTPAQPPAAAPAAPAAQAAPAPPAARVAQAAQPAQPAPAAPSAPIAQAAPAAPTPPPAAAAPALPAAPTGVVPAPARSSTAAVSASAASEPRMPRPVRPFPVTPAQVLPPANRSAGATSLQPVATGFAPLRKVEAIPYLNERGRIGYLEWLQRPTPRAFAIASDGHWSAAWGERVADPALPTDPSERALQLCQRAAHVPCRLYAVNNTVVWVADPK